MSTDSIELPMVGLSQCTPEELLSQFRFLDRQQIESLVATRQQHDHVLPGQKSPKKQGKEARRYTQDSFLQSMLLSPQGVLALTGSPIASPYSHYAIAGSESVKFDAAEPLFHVLHSGEYQTLCSRAPIPITFKGRKLHAGSNIDSIMNAMRQKRLVAVDRTFAGLYTLNTGGTPVPLESVVSAALTLSEQEAVVVLSSDKEYSYRPLLHPWNAIGAKTYQKAVAKDLARQGAVVISFQNAPRTDVRLHIPEEVQPWIEYEFPSGGEERLDGVVVSHFRPLGMPSEFTSDKVAKALSVQVMWDNDSIHATLLRGMIRNFDRGQAFFYVDPRVTYFAVSTVGIEGNRRVLRSSLIGHYDQPSIATQAELLRLSLRAYEGSSNNFNDQCIGDLLSWHEAPLLVHGRALPEQPQGSRDELSGLNALITGLLEINGDDEILNLTMINDHEVSIGNSQRGMPWYFPAYAMREVAARLHKPVILLRPPDKIFYGSSASAIDEASAKQLRTYSSFFANCPKVILNTNQQLDRDYKIEAVEYTLQQKEPRVARVEFDR